VGRQKQKRPLIYKRTHNGDPNPQTGVFGNHDCMKTVRGRLFDAVIGVGGIGQDAKTEGIARKLTWVGIDPHRTGEPSRPFVTFDHFLYYGKDGPLLDGIAPELAKRMYDKNVRVLMDSLSSDEQLDVGKILDLAKNAPPSPQLLSWIVDFSFGAELKTLAAGRDLTEWSYLACPLSCRR
jgi:hypothetical protein